MPHIAIFSPRTDQLDPAIPVDPVLLSASAIRPLASLLTKPFETHPARRTDIGCH
jgi:hypothetical protein